MRDSEREITIRCPYCSALCSYRGEIRPDVKALCGECLGSVTRELKRAFFKDVSVDISRRLVERENQEFLTYLTAAWRAKGNDAERNR